MTAEHDVLLYARGGGFGHAMRGANLQRLLVERGHRVRLLIAPESAEHVPMIDDPRAEITWGSLSDAFVHEFDTIIVDSFPRGWSEEIDEEVLARFSHRVLISRYNRDPNFSDAAARYDVLLNPYPEHLDEWSTPLPRARHTGWIVRPAPMRIIPDGDALVVFDPGARAPSSLLMRLATYAKIHGLRLRHLRRAERDVAAAKFLCIGAGYNTVYELAYTAADLRFVPLQRRYDDQARRVTRLERCAGTLADLTAWIASPTRIQPICDGPVATVEVDPWASP